ncbi:MAG: hypothetical protein ACXWEW_11900 [Nitrososphaeraceae archaeon]
MVKTRSQTRRQEKERLIEESMERTNNKYNFTIYKWKNEQWEELSPINP